MDNTTNAINWFEIPAVDLSRARKFYETVFEIEMFDMPLGDLKMVVFPGMPDSGKVCGALVQNSNYEPMQNGVLIYLNANPSITRVADRVEAAGGKIQVPVTQISPEIGYMCLFIDSEGNRVAMHSQYI